MSSWLPQINRERCKGCGECVAACPTQALQLVEGKASVAAADRCNYSAVCEHICPTKAIALPYLIRFSSSSNKENHL